MSTDFRTLLLAEEGVEAATPRRGFLQNLIAAPVAALATHKLILPEQEKLTTPQDAVERMRHHANGLRDAMQELFPMANVQLQGNILEGGHELYAENLRRGDNISLPTIFVFASLSKNERGNS